MKQPKHMKPIKKSKRFSSEKSAKSFCKKVDGVLKDLRNNPQSLSNFKVTYFKQRGKNKYKEHFDTEWNQKNMDGSFAYNGAAKDF